jgi:hypothetical protein
MHQPQAVSAQHQKRNYDMRLTHWICLAGLLPVLGGCAVVSVASAAVTVTTTTVGVAVDAVELTGKGVVKVGEVAVDAVTPSSGDAAKR